MSYKSLLQKQGMTEEKLAHYHKSRNFEIVNKTKAYYGRLAGIKNDKTTESYMTKAERKIASKLKREQKQYKSALQSLKKGDIGKLKVKKERTITQRKDKTFSIFQERRKLALCDDKWYLTLVDTGERVHYSEFKDYNVQAGHYFGKRNHPNLVFEPMNVRPITYITNKKQLDQEWLIRKQQLVQIIWQEALYHLQAMSKENDNIIRDKNYYQPIYEKYKELLKEEKRRLWI